MNDKSLSPVTEMLSIRHKIWLAVTLIIMFVVDCLVCAYSSDSGHGFVPCVMAIADGLYLIGIALSNQRFKYARRQLIAYIVIYVFLCLLWIIIAFVDIVFDNVTVALWGAVHAVGIVAAIITYLYAARRIRAYRFAQFVTAVVASCVVLLGVVVYYGIELVNHGYFGQGNDVRPLTFEYLSDDECAVIGVESGSGNSVVVPYEFNGHKVTLVSSKVLAMGIDSVTLKCDANVKLFSDVKNESGLNGKTVINTSRQNVDIVKYALYGKRRMFSVGNRVLPNDLSDDEVFITFGYDEQSFALAHETIIPTWVGKRGDAFNLSEIDGVPYVKESDIDSDDDLYYNYINNDKYIMSALQADGANINGSAVTTSHRNVHVGFQKIYKVYMQSGNDSKYDATQHFDYSVVDGVTLDYKLTVAQSADGLLGSLDRGEGFERELYYLADDGHGLIHMDSTLSELLTELDDDVTIVPQWSLVAPTVTLIPSYVGENIVYGDPFSITATVAHPILDELEASYGWSVDGSFLKDIEGYKLEARANNIGLNLYGVLVRASAPDVTSCTALARESIYISIEKRPLTVEWSELEDDVYDGKERTVTATLKNVVFSDDVELTQSKFTLLATAESSYLSAELTGRDIEKYEIDTSALSHTYEIKPRPTEIVWSDNREFLYDGKEHGPTAMAYGLDGVALAVKYDRLKTDVGDHTVTATGFVNNNYTIAENSQKSVDYKITPARVYVIWSNIELTYNGHYQAPTAVIKTVEGTYLTLTVSGARKDAGSGYEATAALPAEYNNYVLNSNKGTFSIARKTLNIYVQDFTVEYGQPLGDTCIIDGMVDGDDVIVESSIEYTPDTHGNVPIGEYDISVTLSGEDKDNYTINFVKSGKITVIAPKQSAEE